MLRKKSGMFPGFVRTCAGRTIAFDRWSNGEGPAFVNNWRSATNVIRRHHERVMVHFADQNPLRLSLSPR